MFVDHVIGAGQGGSRIASMFSAEFEVPGSYLNLAGVDFNYLPVPKDSIFVAEEGGTGRDPEIGESLAHQNRAEIEEFLEERLGHLERGRFVIVCVGGGGGSGAGMMFIILDWLIKRKLHVLMIYTIPEKSEGLPAKPNALKQLNKLIDGYLVERKLSMMVIDNDFCVERYGAVQGQAGSYWDKVNKGMVRALLRFYILTNLEEYAQFVDVTAGYGALDERELKRLLFMKGGFVDIREFVCDKPDPEIALTAKLTSLVFGGLDLGTTKGYIATIGMPDTMKEDRRVPAFLEAMFKRMTKITKTTFVLRSSHFNRKLKEIRINMLAAGLVRSRGIRKVIKQTARDIQKYKDKSDIEMLDLTGIDW